MKSLKFYSMGVCFILTACGTDHKIERHTSSNITIHKELIEHYPNTPINFQLEPASITSNTDIQPSIYWKLHHIPSESQARIDDPSLKNLIFIPDVPGLYTLSVEIINNNQVSNGYIHVPVLAKEIDFSCPIYPVNSLKIQTQSSRSILKDTYIEADLTLLSHTGDISNNLKTEIRGRGNSTWSHSKKPYRLKLFKNDSYEIFNMPKARNWALLANAFDGTNLRNATALCLGQNFIQKSWTPNYRFANLKLNNNDRGLYLITEHVEVAEHKVNLSEQVNSTLTQDNISFFVELTPDNRLNVKDLYVKTAHGHFYEVKSDLSENYEERESELETIRSFLNGFENALFSADFSAKSGYHNFLDLDSAAEYIILNELFKDHDRFWASTHLFKAKNEKLRFGPIWDYDVAAGNFSGFHEPTGWLVMDKLIPQALLKDPYFKIILTQKWDDLYQKLPNLIHYIDLEAQNIAQAQKNNQQIWTLNKYSHSFGSKKHRYLGATYPEQVHELKSWLVMRAEWIHQNILEL